MDKQMASLSDIKLELDLLFSRTLKSQKSIIIQPYCIETDAQYNITDIFSKSQYQSKKYDIQLSFSTEVEYQEGRRFKTFRLMLQGKKLLVLNKLVKKITNQSEKASIKKIPKEVNDIFHPVLYLDFNMVSSSLTIVKDDNKFTLYVLGSEEHKFKFRIQNKEIFNKTVYMITTAIQQSNGFKSNLLGVSMRKNFNKHYYIAEREFREIAKTGDMLLFRGFEFPAVCQRCLTGAKYDHVALIQKENGLLYLYEATSKDGCKKILWRDFMFNIWNLLYDKLVFRELIVHTDNKEIKKKILNQVETRASEYFVQTKGKHYSLSVCSIICGSKKQPHEENNEWDKSVGFSCSALLTGAYVKMGIIPYFADTKSILPGKYAQDSNLPFNPDFSLGPERIIDFSI